ncbi:MAG: hypothetical protein R3313_05025 [Candidatus Saccharimonadales bacterium]|nr:hypothetical protein [Candidatus Saccharimonadales bacterium]
MSEQSPHLEAMVAPIPADFAGTKPKGLDLFEKLPLLSYSLEDIVDDPSLLNNPNMVEAVDFYQEKRKGFRAGAKKGDEISLYELGMAEVIGGVGRINDETEVDRVRLIVQQLAEKQGSDPGMSESPEDTDAWLNFADKFWRSKSSLDQIPPPAKKATPEPRHIPVDTPESLDEVPVDVSDLRTRVNKPNPTSVAKHAVRGAVKKFKKAA